MLRLEQLRPKLKPVSVTLSASGLVVECTAVERPIVFPASAARVLPLLDGQRSVQEIIDLLHHQHGKVKFRSLFSMIEKLSSDGFLEQKIVGASSEKRPPKLFERKPLFFLRPLLERVVTRKRIDGPTRLPLFVALSSAVLASAVFFFLFLEDQIPNTFLTAQGSYSLSLLYLFGASSVLMNLRSVVVATLLWLATGRLHGVSFVLTPTSGSFKTDDFSIHFAKARWMAVLFYLAEAVAPLTLAGVICVIAPKLASSGLMTIAWFLTFQSLTPYAASSFTKLFSWFCAERDLAQAKSYLKNRALSAFLPKRPGAPAHHGASGERRLILYSAYAITWTGLFLFFSAFVAARNFPSLYFIMTAGETSIGDSLGAAFLLGGLSLFLTYLMADLAMTCLRNLLFPLTNAIAEVTRELGGRAAPRPSDETILKALKSTTLFQGISGPTLDRLVGACVVRSYGRGVALLIQGKGNDKLYVLLEGAAYVARRSSSGVRSRLAELEPGAVVGEISALEGSPATADVVTANRCRVLEIPKGVVRAASKDKDASPDLERISAKVLLGQCIASSPLFRQMPAEVATFLSTRGTLVAAPSGTTVTRQGDEDRTLYLVVRGSADVFRDGQKVGEIDHGGFFGEIALITGGPRTASVVTVEDSLLLSLRADDVWSVLSQNPALSLFIETVADQRHEEKTAA